MYHCILVDDKLLDLRGVTQRVFCSDMYIPSKEVISPVTYTDSACCLPHLFVAPSPLLSRTSYRRMVSNESRIFVRLALVSIALYILPTCAGSLLYGDAVDVSIRTQEGEWRTPWREAKRSSFPRFGTNTEASMSPTFPRGTDMEYRIAFSFNHGALVTPYLLLTDGQATFLERIEFKLVHGGGEVRSVRAKPICA
jgi:hypothetical protein